MGNRPQEVVPKPGQTLPFPLGGEVPPQPSSMLEDEEAPQRGNLHPEGPGVSPGPARETSTTRQLAEGSQNIFHLPNLVGGVPLSGAAGRRRRIPVREERGNLLLGGGGEGEEVSPELLLLGVEGVKRLPLVVVVLFRGRNSSSRGGSSKGGSENAAKTKVWNLCGEHRSARAEASRDPDVCPSFAEDRGSGSNKGTPGRVVFFFFFFWIPRGPGEVFFFFFFGNEGRRSERVCLMLAAGCSERGVFNLLHVGVGEGGGNRRGRKSDAGAGLIHLINYNLVSYLVLKHINSKAKSNLAV